MHLDDSMLENFTAAHEIKMSAEKQREIWNNIEREFETMRPSKSQRRITTMLTNIAAAVAVIVVAGGVGYGIHNQHAEPSPYTANLTTATSNDVSKVPNKPYSTPKVTFTGGESNVKKLAKFHVTVPEVPKGYSMQMKLLQTTGYIPQQVWFTLSNGNGEEDITLQEFPHPNISPWAAPMGPSQDLRTVDVSGTSVTMLLPFGKSKSYTEYRFLSNGMCYQIKGPVSPTQLVMSSLIQTPKYLN